MAFINLFEFSSAVRGYHYYRNYWQPQTEQKLVCSQEKDNPYDFFAIKVAIIESGTMVGHLPMENSRVTKYILDRGARVYAILTSTNYCVSPLVQGGLEIPCRIEVHLPSTVKNRELVKIYETFVDTLYYQREETNIVGSFIDGSTEIEKNDKGYNNRKAKKSKEEIQVKDVSSRDIRNFFEKRGTVSSTKTSISAKVVVELSDEEEV